MPLIPAALLCSLAVAPQGDGGAAQHDTVLSKSEQASLNKRLSEWFKAAVAYDEADERRKSAAGKKEQQAKDKFIDEFEARSKAKKRDLLACVGDLQAIFTAPFDFERVSGLGEVRTYKGRREGVADYQVVAPKSYRPENAAPAVLMLRDRDPERGTWAQADDWFQATWKDQENDRLLIMPGFEETMELDAALDFSRPEGDLELGRRLTAVLGTLGQANITFQLDRDRIVLDCGRGSSKFGIRLACYFPQLFAGIVVRQPAEIDSVRLQNLNGLPVLAVASAATKDAAQALAKALNELVPGSCTVLDGNGDYPFTASAPEIAAWCAERRRDLFRPKVIIANNHDRYLRSFWATMGNDTPPLAEVAQDNLPFAEIVADRAANRITVTTRSVNSLGFYLNDAIVDLDKEITFIVNGKALAPVTLQRNLKTMCDRIYGIRDPGFLFPAEYSIEIEREDKKGEKSEKG